ncbi:MAG: hypothetical protein EHM79_00405 [Geobacter sp.]|nr:MAG: hypothetical protein EHM79_00405 [Geobacter sp.]
MALALPSQSFADVQRFFRQKRAVGQQVTPTEERSAWQAYWDAMASRQQEAERIGLEHKRVSMEEERLEEQKDINKKQDRAATVSGIGQLAQTGIIGAHMLKGTALGAKIGLGGVSALPSVVAPTAGQIAGLEAGLGPISAEFAATQGLGSATAATTGATTATTAASGLAGGAAAGGVGLLGTGIGMGAKALIPGDQPLLEAGVGAAGGAMAGAAIGSVVPVVGTVVGAVVGGIGGLLGGGK